MIRAFAILLLLANGHVRAADITDATGRAIHVPDRIQRVVPAGPPAAVLVLAIAPDLMVGWPSPVSDTARAMISPHAPILPQIPRLTGREDVTDRVQTLRAVRDGRAMVAPALPFGWIEEPPSINRLLGLAWLCGHDPVMLAAMFNAVFYGHVLTAEQRDAVLAGVQSP